MALEMLQRLARHARTSPYAVAWQEIDGTCGFDRTCNFARFAAAVTGLAHEIRRVLPPHAVVLIAYANQIELPMALLAVLAAGATAFPVHPQTPLAELQNAARRSRAAALLGTAAHCQTAASIGLRTLTLTPWPTLPGQAAPDFDHVLTGDGARLYLLSSGTTGLPKIVVRTADALDAVARNVACAARLEPGDVVLGVTPGCHSYGVENVILAPLYAGCTVHLCQRFDTLRIHRAAAEGRISVFPGVPAMFELLAENTTQPASFAAARCVYSAGATLPRAVFDKFADRCGAPIGQLYGMSEVGSVTFNDPTAPHHDPACVGLPMHGVRVRIARRSGAAARIDAAPSEEGEVRITAPSMLCGYLADDGMTVAPPSTLRDGFLETGDLGRIDERGRLTITGRTKLVVDVAGLKVNLLEVEDTMRSHPEVRDCVVVPVAVSGTVIRLKAVVVPRAPDAPPAPDLLREFLRDRLAPHKIPRVFDTRASLPRSPTGKILRFQV